MTSLCDIKHSFKRVFCCFMVLMLYNDYQMEPHMYIYKDIVFVKQDRQTKRMICMYVCMHKAQLKRRLLKEDVNIANVLLSSHIHDTNISCIKLAIKNNNNYINFLHTM